MSKKILNYQYEHKEFIFLIDEGHKGFDLWTWDYKITALAYDPRNIASFSYSMNVDMCIISLYRSACFDNNTLKTLGITGSPYVNYVRNFLSKYHNELLIQAEREIKRLKILGTWDV